MRPSAGPGLLVAACSLPAIALALASLASIQPLGAALQAMIAPAPLSLPDLVIHDALLPRILTAWCAGDGLALAAILLQHALRNPLASATTIGISSGAGLVVAVATLAAPVLIAIDRPLVAMVGASAAIGAVLGLSRRQSLSPDALAVTGLLVTLGCGAATTCLALLQGQALGALAVWGGGSLDQRGWLTLRQMALHAAPAVLLAVPLVRPLETMRLEDAGVRNLGLSPATLRVAAVVLAAWLSASIVGSVGNIGFIDLAAAACVRLGVRRLHAQLLWAALTGAAMLWLADGLAQVLGRLGQMPLPTGAVTAVAGAPALVLLASRQAALIPPETPRGLVRPGRDPRRIAIGLLVALCLLTLASLCFGHGLQGWRWSTGEELATLLPWRIPRVVGALSAGVCLALAGVLVQALMANPMASPELLGVGPAASMAGVVLLLCAPDAPRTAQLLVGGCGAFLALLLLLAIVRRSRYSPTRIVLVGIGLTALLGAGLNLAVALMPLNVALVLSWVAGSTYHVTATDALVTALAGATGLVAAFACARWIAILPLGAPTASSVGVALRRTQLWLILLAALLSAAGTLMVGPFAFVGVMAPHLARLAGARRPVSAITVSALAGAMLLVVADFLGRNLLFPYQLPAGTMASFIGMFAMAWLIFRR